MTPFSINSYCYIINTSGQILITQNEIYGNFLKHFVQNVKTQEKMCHDMQERREGSISFYNTETNYAHYRPLQVNDWYLVTTVTEQVATERYDSLIDSTMILCFFTGTIIFLAACLIIAQQKKQHKELERLAYIDPLTGGKNNIKFLLDAATVLEKQMGKHAAILAIDINHFKMINEMLGVEAGNKTICELEKTLIENSKSGEVIGHRIADCFFSIVIISGSRNIDSAPKASV